MLPLHVNGWGAGDEAMKRQSDVEAFTEVLELRVGFKCETPRLLMSNDPPLRTIITEQNDASAFVCLCLC